MSSNITKSGSGSESRSRSRSRFTEDEDEKLKALVMQHGMLNWKLIACLMQSKTERQCKERWYGYLNPSIRNTEWTEEEDDLLMRKYEEHGAKWTKITRFILNRTEIQCKNRVQKLHRKFQRMNKLKKEIERVPSIQASPGAEEEDSRVEQIENCFENFFSTTDFVVDDFSFSCM
jgi:hypothetical protein